MVKIKVFIYTRCSENLKWKPNNQSDNLAGARTEPEPHGWEISTLITKPDWPNNNWLNKKEKMKFILSFAWPGSMFGRSSNLSLLLMGNRCNMLLIWNFEFRIRSNTAALDKADFSSFFDKTR